MISVKKGLLAIFMMATVHAHAAKCGDYEVKLSDDGKNGFLIHEGISTPLVCRDLSLQFPYQVLSCYARNDSNCLEKYGVSIFSTGVFWIAKNKNPNCDSGVVMEDVYQDVCK